MKKINKGNVPANNAGSDNSSPIELPSTKESQKPPAAQPKVGSKVSAMVKNLDSKVVVPKKTGLNEEVTPAKRPALPESQPTGPVSLQPGFVKNQKATLVKGTALPESQPKGSVLPQQGFVQKEGVAPDNRQGEKVLTKMPNKLAQGFKRSTLTGLGKPPQIPQNTEKKAQVLLPKNPKEEKVPTKVTTPGESVEPVEGSVPLPQPQTTDNPALVRKGSLKKVWRSSKVVSDDVSHEPSRRPVPPPPQPQIATNAVLKRQGSLKKVGSPSKVVNSSGSKEATRSVVPPPPLPLEEIKDIFGSIQLEKIEVEHSEMHIQDSSEIVKLQNELSQMQDKCTQLRLSILDNKLESFKRGKEVERDALKIKRDEAQGVVTRLQCEIDENVKLLSLSSNIQKTEEAKKSPSFEDDLKSFISGQVKISLWQDIERIANRDKAAFTNLNSALKLQELESLKEQLTQRSQKIEEDIKGLEAYLVELKKKIKDETIKLSQAESTRDRELENKAQWDQKSREFHASILAKEAFVTECRRALNEQTRVINTEISQLKSFTITTMSRGGPHNLTHDNYILIDGHNYGFNGPVKRGVNINIIDAFTGECIHNRIFDTHDSEDNAKKAIEFIESHFIQSKTTRVLIITAVDEMTKNGIKFAQFMKDPNKGLNSGICPYASDDDYRRPWCYIYDNGPIEPPKVARNRKTENLDRICGILGGGEFNASCSSLNHRVDRVQVKKNTLESTLRQYESQFDQKVDPVNKEIKGLREEKLKCDNEVLRIEGVIKGENDKMVYCQQAISYFETEITNTNNELTTKQGILKGFYALNKEYELKLGQTKKDKSVEEVLAEREEQNKEIAETSEDKEHFQAMHGMIKAIESQRIILQHELTRLNGFTRSISVLENEISSIEDAHTKSLQAQERKLKETETEIAVKKEEIHQKTLQQHTQVELQLALRNLVVTGYKTENNDSLLKRILIAVLPIIHNDQPEYSLSYTNYSFIPDKYTGILKRLISIAEQKIHAVASGVDLCQLERSMPSLIFDTALEAINEEYSSDAKQFKITVVGGLNKIRPIFNENIRQLEIDLFREGSEKGSDFLSFLNKDIKSVVKRPDYLYQNLISTMLSVLFQFKHPELNDLNSIILSPGYKSKLDALIDSSKAIIKSLLEANGKYDDSDIKELEIQRPSLIYEVVLRVINDAYLGEKIQVKINWVNDPSGIRHTRRHQSSVIDICLCAYNGNFLSAVDRGHCNDVQEIYGWAHHLMKIFVYNDQEYANKFFEFHFSQWAKKNNLLADFKKIDVVNLVKYHTEMSAKLGSAESFMELHKICIITLSGLDGDQQARIIYELFNKVCDFVDVHSSEFTIRQRKKLLDYLRNGLSAILTSVIQGEIQDRNKREEARIEYNQDPITRLEKQLDAKFVELETLKEKLTEKNTETRQNDEKSSETKNNQTALENSNKEQESEIKAQIQAKESEIIELTQKKYVTIQVIVKNEQEVAENEDEAIKIVKKLERLREEKAVLESKLSEALEEEKECSVKVKVLNGELNADVNEVESVKGFKVEEEKKLRSLCVQLTYIKLLRYLFKRYDRDLLRDYSIVRKIISDIKVDQSTYDEKFKKLHAKLVETNHFTLLNQFDESGYDVNVLLVDETIRNELHLELGHLVSKLNDLNQGLIIKTQGEDKKGSFELLKSIAEARDLILDPVIFNQLLDVISECVREPEISNVVTQQEISTVNVETPDIPLLCEITGYNIKIHDVEQLLKKEIENRLFIIGLKIENDILVTCTDSPFLGFAEYPNPLQELLVQRVKLHFPRVNGDWPQRNSPKENVKEVLQKLNINYLAVLRAFFNDIVIIAGNDIYLKRDTPSLFPGISLTLIAENSIHSTKTSCISTAGENALEFIDTIKIANSGIKSRNRVDQEFIDHGMKVVAHLKNAPFGLGPFLMDEAKKNLQGKAYKEEGWSKGTAGEDGLNGMDGQNGGHLCLRAKRGVIRNRDSLILKTNGGNGANGQSGGDGDEGKRGYDTPDALVKDTDGMGARQLNVSYARLPGKGPNNEDRPEELGGPGGKGGNAGLGGRGGLAGEITLEDREFIGDITALAHHKEKIEMKPGAIGQPGKIGKGAKGGLNGRQGLDIEKYKPSFWNGTQTRSGKFDDSVLSNPSKLDRGDFKFHFGGCSTNILGATESYRAQINLWGYGEPLPMIKEESVLRNEHTQRNINDGINGQLNQDQRQNIVPNRNLRNETSHKLYLGRKAGELSKSRALQSTENRVDQKMAGIEAEVAIYNARILAGEGRISNKKSEIAQDKQRLDAATQRVSQVNNVLVKVNNDIENAHAVANLKDREYAVTINELFQQQQRMANISLDLQRSTIDKQSLESLNSKLKSVYDSLVLILKQKQKDNEVNQQKLNEDIRLIQEKMQLIEVEIAGLQKMIEGLKDEQQDAKANKRVLKNALVNLHLEHQTQKDQEQEEVTLLMDHHLPKAVARFADLQHRLDEFKKVDFRTDDSSLFKSLQSPQNNEFIITAQQYLSRTRKELLGRSQELSGKMPQIEQALGRVEFCLYCIVPADSGFDKANQELLRVLKLNRVEDIFSKERIDQLFENIDTIYPFYLSDFIKLEAPLKGFFEDNEGAANHDSIGLNTHRVSAEPSELELLLRAYAAKSKDELINIAINHLWYIYPDLIIQFREQASQYSGIDLNFANFITYLYKIREELERTNNENDPDSRRKLKRLKTLLDLFDEFYLSGNTKTFKKLSVICALFCNQLDRTLSGEGSVLGLVAGNTTRFIKFIRHELDTWIIGNVYLAELEELRKIKDLILTRIKPHYRCGLLATQYNTKVYNALLRKSRERFNGIDDKSKERITPAGLEKIKIEIEMNIELGRKYTDYEELFKKHGEDLREHLLNEMSQSFSIEQEHSFFMDGLNRLYTRKCNELKYLGSSVYFKPEFIEVLGLIVSEVTLSHTKNEQTVVKPGRHLSVVENSNFVGGHSPRSISLDELETSLKKYVKYLPLRIEKSTYDFVRALNALANLIEKTTIEKKDHSIISIFYELEMQLENLCCEAMCECLMGTTGNLEKSFVKQVRNSLQSRISLLQNKSESSLQLLRLKSTFYRVLLGEIKSSKNISFIQGNLLFYLDFTAMQIFGGNIDSTLKDLVEKSLGMQCSEISLGIYDEISQHIVMKLAGFRGNYELWRAEARAKKEGSLEVKELDTKGELITFIDAMRQLLNTIPADLFLNKTINQSVIELITKVFFEAYMLSLVHQFNSKTPADKLNLITSFIEMAYRIILNKYPKKESSEKQENEYNQIDEEINELLFRLIGHCEMPNSELIDMMCCMNENQSKESEAETRKVLYRFLLKAVNLQELQDQFLSTRDNTKTVCVSFHGYIAQLNKYLKCHHSQHLEITESERVLMLSQTQQNIIHNFRVCVRVSMEFVVYLRKQYPDAIKVFPLLEKIDGNLKVLLVGIIAHERAYEKLQTINVLLSQLQKGLEKNIKAFTVDNPALHKTAVAIPSNFAFFSTQNCIDATPKLNLSMEQ